MQAYSLNSAALFGVARTAGDRARDNPADSLVAIVFAVAAAESFVNEVLERLQFDVLWASPELNRVRMIAEAGDLYEKNSSMALKVRLLSAALTGAPMDHGAQPYQDFDLLVAVRNTLVHHRPEVLPETGGEPGERQQLLRRLVARGLVPSMLSEDTVRTTFGEIAQHTVAEWALKTALRMVRAVAEFLPPPVAASALLGYRAGNFIQE